MLEWYLFGSTKALAQPRLFSLRRLKLKGHCHGDFAVFRSILCQNHCLVPLLILHIKGHGLGDFAVFRSIMY